MDRAAELQRASGARRPARGRPLLVRAAAGQPVPDVQALEHAVATGPGVLATSDAARTLHLHHSTSQDRPQHAEPARGWDVHPPAGRLRLQLVVPSWAALPEPTRSADARRGVQLPLAETGPGCGRVGG
jgi:hypothetical protein